MSKIIIPPTCNHCQVTEGFDLAPSGKILTRVLWAGMAPQNGALAAVMQIDLVAGQLPSAVQFPQVARWKPSAAYCPRCYTQFFVGLDYKPPPEDEGPKVLVA